jgi:hypothetical protein
MITTYFMILSSESIHSACASFFMVARAEINTQYSCSYARGPSGGLRGA